MRFFMCVCVCFLAGSSLLSADGAWVESLREGELLLNLRFRLEQVDSDPFDKEAQANTLRTRLGYRTAPFHGLRFMLEFENIAAVGGDTYNDTTRPEVGRPVVADREDTEVNQATISYAIGDHHQIVVGRQRIILDNHRFVGNVGWRQNEQTFDAFTWGGKDVGGWGFHLVYVNNVNRIFGEHHPTAGDIPMDTFIAHTHYGQLASLQFSAFAHLVEYKHQPRASHRNLGFYAKGEWPPKAERAAVYEASYVNQSDYADGRDTIDADYVQAALGGKWGAFQIKLTQEILGGDGDYAFTTPLATLHAHNGWADIFLATPSLGLVDRFLTGIYQHAGWKLTVQWHQFESDTADVDYGEEAGLWLVKSWGKRHQASLKFADYQADAFAVDTRKIWLYYAFAY